jgi:hypothetical protein
MSDPYDSASTDDSVSLSSTFFEFCAKVRKDDPSILPVPGQPLRFSHLSEKEHIEVADALLENTNVTYFKLETGNYTKCSAESMAKYVRTSKRLQRIHWPRIWTTDDQELRHRGEMFCRFLPALQESASLKELHMELPLRAGPSNLTVFESNLFRWHTIRQPGLD